jgi:anaerobic ribonucleoside-triphosphate reductase
MTELEIIDEEIKKIEEKTHDPNLARGTAETYDRVSGYFRAISNMNAGKQQEKRDILRFEIALG